MRARAAWLLAGVAVALVGCARAAPRDFEQVSVADVGISLEGACSDDPEDDVAALLLVEGVTDRVPTEVAEHVRESLRFDAATAERVAACGAGGTPPQA